MEKQNKEKKRNHHDINCLSFICIRKQVQRNAWHDLRETEGSHLRRGPRWFLTQSIYWRRYGTFVYGALAPSGAQAKSTAPGQQGLFNGVSISLSSRRPAPSHLFFKWADPLTVLMSSARQTRDARPIAQCEEERRAPLGCGKERRWQTARHRGAQGLSLSLSLFTLFTLALSLTHARTHSRLPRVSAYKTCMW